MASGQANVRVLEQLHRDTYAVEALVLHKPCRNAGIHAATHGSQSLLNVLLVVVL